MTWEQITTYIKQDNKIGMKFAVVVGVCFGMSLIITYTYAEGFWLSGLLNTIGLGAFGCTGIVALVRNERPLLSFRLLHPGVAGVITALVGFVLAIAMLALTLFYLLGGS